MTLFLDRFPFHTWLPRQTDDAASRRSILLPMLVTEPGLVTPPRIAKVQRWVFDTAFSGEAFAWRHHLQEVGLDPSTAVGMTTCAPVFGPAESLPVLAADVWLFSNIAFFRDRPFCISLDEGVAFRNVARLPNPKVNRPLVGVRALRRAGIGVHIDFARDTISVWVPGRWYQAAWYRLQGALSPRFDASALWMPDPD